MEIWKIQKIRFFVFCSFFLKFNRNLWRGNHTKKHKNTFAEVFQNAYTDAKPRKSSEKIVIFDDLGLVLVWKSWWFLCNQKVYIWHFARKMISEKYIAFYGSGDTKISWFWSNLSKYHDFGQIVNFFKAKISWFWSNLTISLKQKC